MTKTEVVTTLHNVIERWGFPVLVAGCLAFFLRQDLLLPLMDSHRETLKEIRETQREIAKTIGEQTRLLYALQPQKTETP